MKTRTLSIVLLLLCLAKPSAQMVDSMPITVQATRIQIGAEFVPRFLDLPQVLTVPAAQTVVAAADSTYDYIEVAGTLKCDRTRDTKLAFTHLIVLPGGTLDCGTAADPIPANRHVEFIVRDVPINLARDPFQWGNGLLNFGTETRIGAAKLAWSPLTTELAAGGTTLTLTVPPAGWVVGDELFIPDTDQPTLTAPIRLEAKVTVKAISGNTVTLSKPLDFAHLAQREPDGSVVLQPRVANLTRNLVLRSEGQGTPGHLADVGHGAMFDIRYNEIDFLGRTKAHPLDNTNADASHIGTNEKGRYGGIHAHHNHGLGSIAIGNVARGVGIEGTKWGFAIHDTSDVVLTDNVCYDFSGACFVTEDGPEVRNTFRRNFAAHVLGTNTGEVNEAELITQQNPGSSGSCYWWRGVQNIIEGNEGWNCSFGTTFVQNGAVSTIAYPSQPGGMPDTFLNFYTAVPVSFVDNVSASNTLVGFEYWAMSRFPNRNPIASYNGRLAFQMSQSDPSQVWLVNPSFIGKVGPTGSIEGMAQGGVHASMAYTDTVEVSGGGRILGFQNGLIGAGGVTFTKLIGTPSTPLRMQNVLDVDMEAVNRYSIEDNVMHKVLPGFSEQFTRFSPPDVWNGQPPLPHVGATYWATQRGSQHYIKNWQGTGNDYRLIPKQALGSYAAWYSGPTDSYHNFNVPEKGLTMSQAWAKYGMAYGGEVIEPADVVPLVGLVNGYARVEGPTMYGPPRAVMTLPNSWDSALIEGDPSDRYVRAYGVVTGDATNAADLFLYSLDGGPVQTLAPNEFSKPGSYSFVLRNLTEGSHEVRTWRANLATERILSTEMVFRYPVGPVTNPPPPALCTDPNATNYNGPAPCTYPPPQPTTCQDRTATNFGGPLPCVYAPVCPVFTISPTTVPSGMVGKVYGQALTVTPAATLSVGPGTALPAGLTLTSPSTIAGTPTTAGSFAFTIQAKDTNQCVASRGYTLVIAPATTTCGGVGQPACPTTRTKFTPTFYELPGGQWQMCKGSGTSERCQNVP